MDVEAHPFGGSTVPVNSFSIRQALDPVDIERCWEFIMKYEWLGTYSPYPTHTYMASYNGMIGGVVIFDMPSPFSKMLGENTKKLERLISRGACAWWTPKNLGSRLIMGAVRDMVKNTRYRLFSAYGDPQAGETGTIYQACNFYYLGQKWGTREKYRLANGKEVSDRYFRTRSAYKRYCKRLGVAWQPEWQENDKIIFNKMPDALEWCLRKMAVEERDACERIQMPPKHKYAYVLGQGRRESQALRKRFLERNKTYPYPV